MKFFLILFSLLMFLSSTSLGGDGTVLDKWDRINYSLGHQVGTDLKRHVMEIDPKIFTEGIQDANADREPRISQQKMQQILAGVQKKIVADKREEIQGRNDQKKKLQEKYWGEGRVFLAENAKKPDVVSLPSGLQYKVIKGGSGCSPGPKDMVSVKYRGILIDGTEFSNSFGEGEAEQYRVDSVVPGWTEALKMMKEGARWQLFIPSDLAYGERGPLADRTVIFDIELLSIVPEKN